ncbi:MAG: diacylglycerol kinase family lipid kinase [Deltaproteobacteria bacterium]|nr:diacylglycerol kinase family lipid kinase [Deltaproteobacteria bacterium]
MTDFPQRGKPPWVVIVNPASADGRTGRRWGKTADIFRRLLPPFDAVFTETPQQAGELALRAVTRGAETIGVHGGDGTVNEVINGLIEGAAPLKETAIALLPSGTGADLVRSLGISHSPARAAAQARSGRLRPVDVCLAEFVDLAGKPCRRYFINVADIGFGGEVVRYVNSHSKRLGGRISFLLGLVATLFRYSNKRLRVSLDEQPPFEVQANAVVIANGRYFGGGMRVAPSARVDDGRLEVVVVGDVTKAEVLTNIPRLYRGTLAGHPKVQTFQAGKVLLESAEEVLIDLDGELVGRLPVRIVTLAGKIQIRV